MPVIQIPTTIDYSGRMLMLNVEQASRFQCPGFSLSKNNSYQIVPSYKGINDGMHEAMNRALHTAVLSGRLVDITGQDIKGLKLGDNEHTPVQEEDTGMKVFMATDKQGNLYVVMPKDKDEEARFVQEIKDTGTLKLDYERAAETKTIDIEPEVSKIIITDND